MRNHAALLNRTSARPARGRQRLYDVAAHASIIYTCGPTIGGDRTGAAAAYCAAAAAADAAVLFSAASSLCAVACGAVTDRLFRRRFKTPLVAGLVVGLGASVWFGLSLCNPFFASSGPPSSQQHTWLLATALLIIGASQGVTIPLCYELYVVAFRSSIHRVN